jgi:hypothetical protein
MDDTTIVYIIAILVFGIVIAGDLAWIHLKQQGNRGIDGEEI